MTKSPKKMPGVEYDVRRSFDMARQSLPPFQSEKAKQMMEEFDLLRKSQEKSPNSDNGKLNFSGPPLELKRLPMKKLSPQPSPVAPKTPQIPIPAKPSTTMLQRKQSPFVKPSRSPVEKAEDE